MKPPIPPPCRIIREGGVAYSGYCDICGSSLKRRWFGLGKVIGCLQPKCWNWHGWSHLPTGHNRPIDLYGAPEKPPYRSQLPMPTRYPPMPEVKSPAESDELVYWDALIRIIALHNHRNLLDAQTIAEEAIARGKAK